jgi:hypothetical protein
MRYWPPRPPADRVEIADQAHLHPCSSPTLVASRGISAMPFLRGEVGLPAIAQRPHHGPHLGEGTGALVLDELECIERRRRV